MPPTKTTTFTHRFYSGWPKFTAGLLAASLGLIALQTPCALASPSETVIHGELTQINQQMDKLYVQGKYQNALPLAEKLLAIAERSLGYNHPITASSLNNLAELYRDTGAYTKAETFHLRALAIREKILGSEHPDVATSLDNLANLYSDIGAYTKAEPLHQRALKIYEKTLGSEHLDTLICLRNLAMLYSHLGAYTKAESISQRALAISENTLGSEHTETAASLMSLAGLYLDTQAYNKAEPLYRRALAIREKVLGSNHPKTADSLHNLALLYNKIGDYTKAEPLYVRVLAISKKELGSEHPDTASSLDNLAVLYSDMGEHSKAKPLFQRALAIREKILGVSHPSTATSLNNLAEFNRHMGAYDQAEPLYQRALAVSEKTLGNEHPRTADSLDNLSLLYWGKGEWSAAENALRRALKIREFNIKIIQNLGEEARIKAYMAHLRYGGEISFILAANHHIKHPYTLGLEAVLHRKGRVLELMTNSLGLLRQHLTPANQALLDELAALRTQQAALHNRGSDNLEPALNRAEVEKLNAHTETLEHTLINRSAEFRSQFQPVTLERVQAALPKGSALVELVAYRPFNPKPMKPDERFGTPHYMAYVLHPSGESKGSALGEAKEIDALIEDWRKALSNPHDDSVRSNRGVGVADNQDKLGAATHAGHLLYAKLIKPLLPLIGSTKNLFVAPDGALNLVPLGALPDESGHYLLETHEINYLTSGRDMLKWSLPANTAKQPVVLASPDFGSIAKKHKEPVQLAANDRGRRSNEYTRGKFHFDPLSGTAEEAKELSKLLTDGTVLTGAEATETALKDLHSPRILHLATHGFFLPDQPAEKPDAKTAMLSLDGQRPLPPSKNENPLLRSGIALAGANELQSGNEDGVLTALEASGLDLWGTQLVVLSACETGIGKVANGEGVYGLRRALVNAGAQSQVMSLWKVDDAATRDLMVDYYKRLLAGAGRAEALRQTQLAMLNSKDRNHPYYWAAFIASGDVRPIDKK